MKKWLVFCTAMVLSCSLAVRADVKNLVTNPDFEKKDGSRPAGFELSGAATYQFLGDPRRDLSSNGIALSSTRSAGAVTCTVRNIDSKQGKWFRFSFRGLPLDGFAVKDEALWMKVEFFGRNGTVSYDAKEKRFYEQVQNAREDLGVNGVRHQHGAEVWTTYQLDFCLPFPQVDTAKLSVGFDHGAAKGSSNCDFYVDDVSLIAIPEPKNVPAPATQPAAIVPEGKLLPLGGRWYYVAKDGETSAPKQFDVSNVDHLLYHDAFYSAPFAGNTSAVLRTGDMSADGSVVSADKLISDNVIITFERDAMVIKTHSIPNHPTGRFPELGFGNRSYITERVRTYYFPLNPAENASHTATSTDNSNHALNMGPIGLAVNGVVFFNPFDANSQDAADLMDRCCGHPAPDGQYHYHKYPICVNSPWTDEGKTHSPLLGFAFDGFPLYGPYEGKDVMAKDVTGENALNEFNMHYDKARGWHYHVTPGKFPYIIGGYWGKADQRDIQRGPPGGGMGRQGQNGAGQNGPSQNGQGPNGNNGQRGPGNGPPGGRFGGPGGQGGPPPF